MKKLFFISSIFLFFSGSLYAENACQKYYKLNKVNNEYVRLIPDVDNNTKDNKTFDNKTREGSSYETSWNVDCKNNQLIYSSGDILREYKIESLVYYDENKKYIVKFIGMDGGVPVKKELSIDYLDVDKVYIYGILDNKTENIYTTVPTNYKVMK